jgi:vancomycin permeability regulator SanA
MRRRVSAALEFGRHLQGVCYLPTGGLGKYGPSEASLMAALLREGGAAEAPVLLEETGHNTLSSVRAVARMLRERGHRGRVYVASSDYHLPRCILLMQLGGLDAWACPPPEKLPRLAQRWFWRLREALALPKDVVLLLGLWVLGRWRVE